MATTAAAEAIATRAPFRMGKKQVFLPNHIIALLRPKPHQPPTQATFTVPLKFNKLDFKDYLYNVYNVRVTAVRSFINRIPMAGTGTNERTRKLQPKKMMTVELVQPFVWPEKPEDTSAWQSQAYEAVGKNSKKMEEQYMKFRDGHMLMRDERKVKGHRLLGEARIREEAGMLLRGEKRWTSGAVLDERWSDMGKRGGVR